MPSLFGNYTEHLQDVRCDVKNCVYNEDECCFANDIKIGPSYAATQADTICGTFKEQ